MRCEVTQLAFHEGRRVRPGEIVYLDGRKCPKWAKEAPKVAREVPEPVAKPARVAKPAKDAPKAPPAGEPEGGTPDEGEFT